MKKSLLSLAVVLLSVPLFAANQGASSNGATVASMVVPADGNGNHFEVGFPYKVFEDSGSVSAVLLVDENGNAPSCAIIHAVCIDAGSGFVNTIDASSTSGITDVSANSVTGEVSAASGALTCQVFDSIVEKGAVVVNSTSVLSSHILWRRCGGSN